MSDLKFEVYLVKYVLRLIFNFNDFEIIKF